MEHYQEFSKRFIVDKDLIRNTMADREPKVLEALSHFGQRHVWKDSLPVYSILTTPPENGGWGYLMPLWFKPSERPVPYYALNDWSVFALAYQTSFGDSPEALELAEQVFTVENLVKLVVSTNLLLPFLPSTDGQGFFFRHGMLPYVLSIQWLEEDVREAWFRLHELGAARFIRRHNLGLEQDPSKALATLEHEIFGRLESNRIEDDATLQAFLNEEESDSNDGSFWQLYQDMFGAITLGITALAKHYQDKPLAAWREWFYQEISYPYRMPDYGEEAIKNLIKNERNPS